MSKDSMTQIVDDSNFIFLKTGTYPIDYFNLRPVVIYDTIKQRGWYETYTLPQVLNVNAPIVQEYWEKIPREILSKGSLLPEDCYVSTFGRVYNYTSKTMYRLKYGNNNYGYIQAPGISNVHRVVLYTFNPITNFKEMTVDHISCDPSENYLWNLRWVPMRDNIKYANWHNNRISDSDVEMICKAICSGYSITDIAKYTGISYSTIKHICNGNSHTDISSKYFSKESSVQKLNNIFGIRPLL